MIFYVDPVPVFKICNIGSSKISYCMRKMLRRVPKGDWLCEECKFAEETDNQKQGIVD